MQYTESDLVLHIENRIPAYNVSFNGQTKFYNLAGLLLESAARHASIYGFGYDDMKREKVYWVLSRFHVVMHSYPRMNDKVFIETWHKGPDGVFFIRDYRMFSEDMHPLVSATSAWLVLDGNTGRPKKMGAESIPYRYTVKDLHAIDKVPDKLPAISEPDLQMQVTARYSDLDINNHVSAIRYIQWIQDCYGEETYRSENIREFQINYQLETRFGEQLDIRMKNRKTNDPFDYFEALRSADKNQAFRARTAFGRFD